MFQKGVVRMSVMINSSSRFLSCDVLAQFFGYEIRRNIWLELCVGKCLWVSLECTRIDSWCNYCYRLKILWKLEKIWENVEFKKCNFLSHTLIWLFMVCGSEGIQNLFQNHIVICKSLVSVIISVAVKLLTGSKRLLWTCEMKWSK